MAVPDWQLPQGVTRGAWDYARSKPAADEYDDYHAGNPLFDVEAELLCEELGEPDVEQPGVIADFGCGYRCARAWRENVDQVGTRRRGGCVGGGRRGSRA